MWMKTVNKGMVAKQTSFCYPHFYERYKVSHHFMATQCTLRRFSNAKILPRVFELPWENINDKVNTNNVLLSLLVFLHTSCSRWQDLTLNEATYSRVLSHCMNAILLAGWKHVFPPKAMKFLAMLWYFNIKVCSAGVNSMRLAFCGHDERDSYNVNTKARLIWDDILLSSCDLTLKLSHATCFLGCSSPWNLQSSASQKSSNAASDVVFISFSVSFCCLLSSIVKVISNKIASELNKMQINSS